MNHTRRIPESLKKTLGPGLLELPLKKSPSDAEGKNIHIIFHQLLSIHNSYLYVCYISYIIKHCTIGAFRYTKKDPLYIAKPIAQLFPFRQ